MQENQAKPDSVWWKLGPKLDCSYAGPESDLALKSENIGIAIKDAWLDVWEQDQRKSDEILLNREDIGSGAGYPLDIDWLEDIDPEAGAAVWAVTNQAGLEEALLGLVRNGMDQMTAKVLGKQLGKAIGSDEMTIIAARGPESRHASGLLALTREVEITEGDDESVTYNVKLVHYTEPADVTINAALVASFGEQALADQEALAASLHKQGIHAPIYTAVYDHGDIDPEFAAQMAEMIDYAQDCLFGVDGADAPEGYDFETSDLKRSFLL